MGNDVFANGREVSCKAADGKSICAFPDVCMTPLENPATPPGVPVPYPNTGMASDATSGSKTVKISGKEVMLKNKSYFKKSTGDEAGRAAKKGADFSVVLFRSDFALVSEKNYMKVHKNQWFWDRPYSLGHLSGAISRGHTMAPEGQTPSQRPDRGRPHSDVDFQLLENKVLS